MLAVYVLMCQNSIPRRRMAEIASDAGSVYSHVPEQYSKKKDSRDSFLMLASVYSHVPEQYSKKKDSRDSF